MTSSTDTSVGKVILAGAGPGDPELLTVKASRFLRVAEVVIVDRLVSDAILEYYVNPHALVIHVGKQAKNSESTSQAEINEMMIHYALQNKLVVRLKGGDLSFFANVLDELEALTDSGIPFELIPGVTAASGAAAFAGIPLTARGYSSGVRFLTYCTKDIYPESFWLELADSNDTLVFYMSSGNLAALIEKLLATGNCKNKHIAVIEQATTPAQRTHVSRIFNCLDQWQGKNFLTPALLIIGDVVALHQRFQWMPSAKLAWNYFKPLQKKSGAGQFRA